MLSWKDKSLLIWLVGKRLHYWQEDRICRRGNISYIWPAHSITERGCFSGLYIITRVLFISPRSMVMRGGPRKMDATGRLTYRLLNRETHRPGQGRPAPFTEMNRGSLCFESAYLSHPSVVSYYAWQHFYFSKIYLLRHHRFFCPFVCVECVIVCLAQGVKGEGEKSGNGLPGDHFLETVQEADGRAG